MVEKEEEEDEEEEKSKVRKIKCLESGILQFSHDVSISIWLQEKELHR